MLKCQVLVTPLTPGTNGAGLRRCAVLEWPIDAKGSQKWCKKITYLLPPKVKTRLAHRCAVSLRRCAAVPLRRFPAPLRRFCTKG